MGELITNANEIAIVGLCIGVAVLIVLVALCLFMISGLLDQIKFCHNSITEYRESIDNLTQASKRTERMCDAINQRTRSYSAQLKQKATTAKLVKFNRNSNKPNNKPNKGQKKNYENKKTNDESHNHSRSTDTNFSK